MKLADRSPGLTIVLAFAVVYGMIGIEIVMWMISSALATYVTLAIAIVTALLILRWFHHLLDEEEPGELVSHAPKPAEQAAPAPATKRPAPALRPALHH